jgi:hypothetical protein
LRAHKNTKLKAKVGFVALEVVQSALRQQARDSRRHLERKGRGKDKSVLDKSNKPLLPPNTNQSDLDNFRDTKIHPAKHDSDLHESGE